MTHEYQPTNTKQPKVYFQQYLYNTSEPRDITSNDTPVEFEAELREDSNSMRQQVRHTAQRLRNRYF